LQPNNLRYVLHMSPQVTPAPFTSVRKRVKVALEHSRFFPRSQTRRTAADQTLKRRKPYEKTADVPASWQ
jgi:hypothetical protein